jgi:hypothetical protein
MQVFVGEYSRIIASGDPERTAMEIELTREDYKARAVETRVVRFYERSSGTYAHGRNAKERPRMRF